VGEPNIREKLRREPIRSHLWPSARSTRGSTAITWSSIAAAGCRLPGNGSNVRIVCLFMGPPPPLRPRGRHQQSGHQY